MHFYDCQYYHSCFHLKEMDLRTFCSARVRFGIKAPRKTAFNILAFSKT